MGNKEDVFIFESIDDDNAPSEPWVLQSEFGSKTYYKDEFDCKKDSLIPGFLEEQLEKILNQDYKDKDKLKQHLTNLAETYYEIRIKEKR